MRRAVSGTEGPQTGRGVGGSEGVCHLVFLPDRPAPRFFLWGSGAAGSSLARCGRPQKALVLGETLAAREVAGVAVPLLEALPLLAAMNAAETERAPASVAAWSLAAKLALDLVGRERLVPRLVPTNGGAEARFAFTQFREMGNRLVAALTRALGIEVPFLHGGVARAARDAMVRRFQDDPRGPQVFVLSVKAGGTGLNLTTASHVFHFDRWWNPAVEDQATDRAHRIGQQRAVQVHKLLTAGTVEEKVDAMLEKKRDLASRIVGAGEQWITELGDAALRELFSLASDAVVASDEADESDGLGEPGPAPRRRVRTSADVGVHP